ncbi:MAG: hypothetical protein Q7K57_42005 [Burkholderiaceae bacterium]|nr:hypothetical protein [Burkholderiaceae bacterium]
MSIVANGGRLFLVVLAMAVSAFVQAAGEDNAFMPKGGRALLLDLLGAPPDQVELRAIAQARRTEPQWLDFIAARKKPLTERELATLAAYLAVNMPLSDDALKRDNLASALPPDGRDLAWNGCQSCHSLFASHLTQKRNAQGWRNMFLSPFHRELNMNPQEREEFARYSALNMPMKIDDVPPDLRF